MTTYSVESYNSNTEVYIRYETGTKEDMMSKLNELVQHDIDNGVDTNYYKVSEISDIDSEYWDKQKQAFPGQDSSEFVFGEWIQIDAASKYLGVTFGRVYNLITANQLTSHKSENRNTLVLVKDVVDRKINNPRAGRPSSKNKEIESTED